MKVEVAYAKGSQQILLEIEVKPNCTIKDAIIQSQILNQVKEIDQIYLNQNGTINIESLSVGIFGKQKTLSTIVNEADRIEIYRPLQIDPKEARRNRAKIARRSNFEANRRKKLERRNKT